MAHVEYTAQQFFETTSIQMVPYPGHAFSPDVEYVVFDDEGHGFTKRKNRVAASEAYLKFPDTYLRD